MISLDQILLLENKVESAVKKIIQLQAENDALRKSCAELTNSLSAKSEQLSSFEQDQSKIENGIIKALDRLNSIENSVLKAAGQASSIQQKEEPEQPKQFNEIQNNKTNLVITEENNDITENKQEQSQFYDMSQVSNQTDEFSEQTDITQNQNTD